MATGTVSSVTGDNWQLIASNDLAGVSTSTISGIAGYKTLMIIMRQALPSASSSQRLEFNGNSTVGDYYSATGYINLGSNTAANGQFVIVYDANKSIPHIYEGMNTGAAYQKAAYLELAPITSVRVFSGAAVNWTSGTFAIYGIAA